MKIRGSVMLGLACLLLPAAEVVVDSAPDARVDLMATVFHLAGNPEYSRVSSQKYGKVLDSHFATFRDHPVVKLAREFRQKNGVSYDAVMGLAIRLDSVNDPKLDPKDEPSLDARWPRDRMGEFLDALKDFSQKSGFERFFNENREIYREQTGFYKTLAAEADAANWVKRFFRPATSLHFTIIPCELASGGYGLSLEKNGTLHCCQVVMPLSEDVAKNSNPALKETFSSFIVHEFTHPYSNPFVEKNYSRLSEIAELANAPVADRMKRMAYGLPYTLMIETFNRAVNCVYITDHFGEKSAGSALDRERESGFLLVEPLYRCMIEERRKGGDAWSFEQGGERYIAVMNGPGARRIIADYQAVQKLAPGVQSIVPANGAKDVDPELSEIKVTFSKPMRDKSWAVCQRNPALYPKVAGVGYDKTCTVLTIKVKLEPEHDYLILLNAGRFNSFISADGHRLPEYVYRFHTGKKK